MEESIIISSSKELSTSDGIVVVDLATGANTCPGFKSNICGVGGKVCTYYYFIVYVYTINY